MINHDVRVQEASSCMLCGSEGVSLYKDLQDRLFRAPGTWGLVCCPTCGLTWLNPRPVPSDVGKLYAQYFTHDAATAPTRLGGLRRMVRDSILAARFGYDGLAGSPRLGRVLSWIGPVRELVEFHVMTLGGQKIGKLLDVGCGNGRFLASMRELGWEVVGVEPDPDAARVAREAFGLEVYAGDLDEIKLGEESFDAVTMNHVIEHVSDPVGLFKACRRVLKPGGRLVAATPNIESLGRCWFGEAWFAWDPPRHLFLFSQQTLRRCAQSAGLRVEQLRTISRGARAVWQASRLIQRDRELPGGRPQHLPYHLRFEGVLFWILEYVLATRGHWGEEIALIARADT